MSNFIIWEHNSTDIHNSEVFLQVKQWWESLAGQEMIFAQRLLSSSESVQDLDWSPQRFDETVTLTNTRVGGITLYWSKQEEEFEHSITLRKLEFHPGRQELYIYSQAQQQLVIRVSAPTIQYNTITLTKPNIAGAKLGANTVILFQDPTEQLELKVTLDTVAVEKLRHILS
ncbi:hypothetical protein K4A83_09485 [Spirulina subsalsa FACHB-351]|uniref:Uncharacterized protein n=1 Tax=Spirulina subsalsa FACHB-351 TaxID=234711 RepID=A0ABT3L4W2_9CYAN|nr:hypothetical protein [Spirulina subsalsa]MCW6036497.1 hypothetical protein [Spirulina subsalsa FACHB-351]